MNPAEYRAAQDQLNRRTAIEALALARAMSAGADGDGTWARLARSLFAVLVPQRAASQRLATAYYGSLTPYRTVPPMPRLPYAVADTRNAVERFRPRIEDAETVRGRRAAQTQLAAAMVRHGEQAGRETVLQATRRDGARYARIDPRPPCCAFCLMLISRGPVYLSDGVRSGGFLAHDHCTCVPVPVFSDDWAGREQHEAAEAFYIEHAAGAGKQLSALRAAVRENGSPV